MSDLQAKYLEGLVRDLAAVVEQLPSAVYVCEAPSGVIRLFNRRAAALWGREPRVGETDERFCGSWQLFRLDGTALPHAETPMADALREGHRREADVVIARPDGSRVPVRVNIEPLTDAAGRILGAVNVFQDLGDRLRLEEQLRMSEARYRAIVDSDPDLVCRFLPDGTLTFVNDAYCRYFALCGDDVIGTRRVPFSHPDDRAAIQAAVAGLTPANRVTTIENRVLRGDGTFRWTQWTNHAIFDADHRLVEYQASGRDITERKRMEEAAARLAAIVASAEDAIISKTIEGTIVSWNRAAERMFGYPEADIVGKPITTIVPADLQDEEAEILRRLEAGETIQHLETERLHRDGRRIPISVTVSPVFGTDGRIVGASTIARDITERKWTEEALRRRERELSDFFENAALPIHWVGPDGIILRVNKAELGMLGYTAEEYVGRHIADIHVDRPMLEELLRRLDAGETVVNEPAQLRCKDGSIREVLITSNVLREDGRFVHTRCFTRDITELRRLEREREDLLQRERQARAQAEAANQAKDEFLAMLAHELRNPISVIAHAAAVVEAEPQLSPAVGRSSAVIRRQTGHLARLLDQLLDVARITSGRIELDRSPVDLREAVEQAVETQRHRTDAKQQRVDVVLPATPVTVVGDLVRMHQVVANLMNNASKYTPEAGAITVALEVDGPEAVLRIQDTGVGIAPEHLTSVFDAFVQLNPTLARSEGGLGIGLTLVKRMVELHGGAIVARSDGVGRGAEFVVRMPLAAAAPVRDTAPSAAPPAPTCRVLVIEDNDDGRDMLATLLGMTGHDVLMAATGREGCDIATRHAPDVVLLDIGLPDINGYDLGREIRQRLGAKVRIIAITGYGQPADRRRSEEAGFDGHLVKPVDPATLTQALRGTGGC